MAKSTTRQLKMRLQRAVAPMLFTCLATLVVSLATVGQQAPVSQSEPSKVVGLLQELIEPTPNPRTYGNGPFDSQVIVGAFESDRSRPDPNLISKSLPTIRLTLELKSGVSIKPWVRLLLPKSQLARIEGKHGSVLVTIDQPGVKTLKRLADEPSVVSIDLDRPPTLGPPPGYVRPVDIEARRSHMVEEFLAENSTITGSGIVGAIFDEGKIRTTHLEFRKVKTDPASSTVQARTLKALSRHSSHVAGIVSAKGVREEAIGMAPDAKLLSYDWDNDLSDLTKLAGQIQFSSHSYGPITGWYQNPQDGTWYWYGDRTLSNDEDARFGKYTATEAKLDDLLHSNPKLITFVAAGNARGYNPPQQPIMHLHRDVGSDRIVWTQASDSHKNSDYKQGGLDTLSGLGISKNSICVGSIEPITPDRQIAMTSYSSWGPTDDGRIKPDVVANGQKLLSVSYAADDAYLPMSGTSMATPAVAGIAALLVQDFRVRRGREPLASDIKAILIHSADDAGLPGPDPVFGWGAVNALTAGRVIARKTEHLIEEANLVEGQDKIYRLEANGQPVRVTITWTDPPGEPNLKGLNDPTPTLKDDLDLEVDAPDGTPYYPYSLDPSNPLAPARHDRPNKVDNVEEVDAPFHAGIWTIHVKATKLSDRSQKYSLVTTGFLGQ